MHCKTPKQERSDPEEVQAISRNNVVGWMIEGSYWRCGELEGVVWRKLNQSEYAPDLLRISHH